MTNAEFVVEFKELVKTERKITRQVLEGILKAEDRRVHLERGYSSLFIWLVEEIGYSESAAGRRIASARLLRSVPEAAAKLDSGEVNLTTLSQAKAAMRAHTKVTGKKLSAKQQAEVVQKISNKTSREAQETLFQEFPETASPVHQQRETILNEEMTRLAFNMDKQAMEDLTWIKNFLAHSIPDGDLGKVFAKVLREFREKQEAKGERSLKSDTKTAAKKTALHRVERKCEYRDPETGKICGSSFMVEVDHIHPRALGGKDELCNYRCLCRAHNQFEAWRKLGSDYELLARRDLL